MKTLIVTLCLTLALSLFNATRGWSADFAKGWDAYQQGDYATALCEWESLANLGDALSQSLLGLMYEKGEGVPQDYQTAAKLWTLTAEQRSLSLKIFDGFFDYGSRTCKQFELGEFRLYFSPITILDITNDNTEDYILSQSAGGCDTAASLFQGGTGGRHFFVYINPELESLNVNNYFDLLVRHWEVIDYNGKVALEITEHGDMCGVAGYRGCTSKVFLTSDGLELIGERTPGPK